MPLEPSWTDLALRLILTIAAGAIIGLNREASGHAAGLRTTMIVCLAASVAMIQTNLLLAVVGKTAGSFSVMDVMRLPLGILTGVGFIGGGAILRRGDLVTGITTAATLWVVTVIGLCLGGGQIGLGIAATILAAFILWALKWVDQRLPHWRQGILVIASRGGLPTEANLAEQLSRKGCRLQVASMRRDFAGGLNVMRYHVSWRAVSERAPLDLGALQNLAGDAASIEWLPGVRR